MRNVPGVPRAPKVAGVSGAVSRVPSVEPAPTASAPVTTASATAAMIASAGAGITAVIAPPPDAVSTPVSTPVSPTVEAPQPPPSADESLISTGGTAAAAPASSATPPPPTLPTPAQRLGMRLRQARLRQNMTQAEVAQKQFSVSYISAVERGQIRPSLGALERLAERLAIPLADLLQDRDSANVGLADRGRESVYGSYGSYGDRQREEIETRLREGRLLVYQSKPTEAIATLESLTGRTLSLHDQVLLRWRLAQGHLASERGEDARREAQEGLLLAERAGDVELREHLREALGQALGLLRKWQQALDQFRLCDDAVRQGVLREPIFQLTVLYDLGATYWALGDSDGALASLRQAAELAAEVTRPQRLGRRYQQISADYAQQHDTARTRYYAQRSLTAFEAGENLRLTGQIYNRLGRAKAHAGQTSEALDDLRAALELAEEQQDLRGVAEAQRTLATIFVAQQQIDDAASAIDAAQRAGAEIHDPVLQGETLLVLAQVQEARKRHAEAEASYEQALTLLRGADAAQHLSDAYAQFSAFLERRGQSKRALEFLKQALTLRGGATG